MNSFKITLFKLLCTRPSMKHERINEYVEWMVEMLILIIQKSDEIQERKKQLFCSHQLGFYQLQHEKTKSVPYIIYQLDTF